MVLHRTTITTISHHSKPRLASRNLWTRTKKIRQERHGFLAPFWDRCWEPGFCCSVWTLELLLVLSTNMFGWKEVHNFVSQQFVLGYTFPNRKWFGQYRGAWVGANGGYGYLPQTVNKQPTIRSCIWQHASIRAEPVMGSRTV